MNKGRMEAFTDGVMAVIITILVLEIRAPAGATFAALAAEIPNLAAYALTFVMVGIYWNNHHHMLQATARVNGAVLWANLFLLFWLSLFPLVIRWANATNFASLPVAAYGAILLLSGLGYMLLQRAIIAADEANAALRRAVGEDWKIWATLALDGIAIAMAFYRPWAALGVYVVVAALWLVPDRRIETSLKA